MIWIITVRLITKKFGTIHQTKVTLIIPAKAGIQEYQKNNMCLDTRFHGYDVVYQDREAGNGFDFRQ